MKHNQASIIQWNCRGLTANFEETKNLISDHNPMVLCLQETLLKDTNKTNFKNYDMYNVTSISPLDGRRTGGSSLIIKRGNTQ